MDHGNFDKELTFENTPLQNLKNILSNAEASMDLNVGATDPEKFGLLRLQERQGITKTEIRKVIEELLDVPGKYVSAAFIGRVACQLCAQKEEWQSPEASFSNNIYINKINQITRAHRA